eukprot:5812341-Prymnesium_polylepis.1
MKLDTRTARTAVRTCLAHAPAPPAGPPPSYHPSIEMSGLCSAQFDFSGVYTLQGSVANDAPYYLNSVGKWLFYDLECCVAPGNPPCGSWPAMLQIPAGLTTWIMADAANSSRSHPQQILSLRWEPNHGLHSVMVRG